MSHNTIETCNAKIVDATGCYYLADCLTADCLIIWLTAWLLTDCWPEGSTRVSGPSARHVLAHSASTRCRLKAVEQVPTAE